MTKLLFIKASPRKGASSPIAVAQSYPNALRGREPDLDRDGDFAHEKQAAAATALVPA